MLTGTLYRATARIEQGATITPGTNCTAVTVGSELLENANNIAFQAVALNNRITTVDGEKADWSALAMVQSGSIAAFEYPSGSLFVYNGYLYQATENIDIGDTITPGTNCAQTQIDTKFTDVNGKISNLRRDAARWDYLVYVNQGSSTQAQAYFEVGDYFIYNDKIGRAHV